MKSCLWPQASSSRLVRDSRRLSVYGLKQAPLSWYETLTDFLYETLARNLLAVAMYSALVVERAMQFCFLDDQLTNLKQKVGESLVPFY